MLAIEWVQRIPNRNFALVTGITTGRLTPPYNFIIGSFLSGPIPCLTCNRSQCTTGCQMTGALDVYQTSVLLAQFKSTGRFHRRM
jgi:hypothetical protein